MLRRPSLLVLLLAGCGGSPAGSGDADSSATVSCRAPSILSPTEGASTGLSIHLVTSAPACSIATKCYIDGNPTPVASAGRGGIDQWLNVAAGADNVECNDWDSAGHVYRSATISFHASVSSSPDAGTSLPDATTGGGDAGPPRLFDVDLASLWAHNTSANAAYDRNHFGANFGTASWVSQGGATVPVDPSREDLSMNPVTPAHVSHVDVHTLIPSRPDLRWFAHVVPWFRAGGGGGHIDIGVDSSSTTYVKAMIDDMMSRGFDGVIIDWYGSGSYEDGVTSKIQQYIATLPAGSFSFIVMVDKGVRGLSQSVLQQQIGYIQSHYFGDANYEREGGKPILMFFGVQAVVTSSEMAAVKAATGGNMVWVVEGTGSLSLSWVDAVFDWTHDFHDGVNTSDPYNLSAVGGFYAGVAGSGKQAFGSMVAGFNGTLTRSVGWSQGKYLPRGSGACLVAWAKKIDAVIPANVRRMQWATWSDWEEGSEIEAGVENDFSVHASIQGTMLAWSSTSGTHDESTIDHYEVYGSADGVHAADLGRTSAGTRTLDLRSIGGLPPGVALELYVDAVGKPNVRDHLSPPIAFTP
jgi:hypothetical protein